MSKHTPGPWSQVPQSDGSTLIARRYETGNQMKPMGLRIVGFTMARKDSLQEDEANARLIAAAPELLEALKDMLDGHEDACTGYGEGAADKARAAIAKATGGEV